MENKENTKRYSIKNRSELNDLAVFKHQLVCQKKSVCQNVRLEYYTNYNYDYIYRYKNGYLEEVVKYECKNRSIQ